MHRLRGDKARDSEIQGGAISAAIESCSMITPEKRREIASLGGKSIPSAKRSFSQNRELAREAGRKGGLTPKRTKVKLTSSEINNLADSMLAKLHVEPEHG